MTAPQLQQIYERTRDRRAAAVPVKFRKLYLRVLEGQASPRQAIKAMCMECIGWEAREVALCTSPACPLYLHRPFKDPSTIFPRRPENEVAPLGSEMRPPGGLGADVLKPETQGRSEKGVGNG
jgi:hypothetical protein